MEVLCIRLRVQPRFSPVLSFLLSTRLGHTFFVSYYVRAATLSARQATSTAAGTSTPARITTRREGHAFSFGLASPHPLSLSGLTMPPPGFTRPLVALLRTHCGGRMGRPGPLRATAPPAAWAASCLATAAAARPPAAVTVPVGAPPPPPAAAPPVTPNGAAGRIRDAPILVTVETRPADGGDVSSAVSAPPVRLSASAAARLGELGARVGGNGDGAASSPTLRLSVDGGGCAGLVYQFSLEGADGGAVGEGKVAEPSRGVDEEDEDVEDTVIVAENGATLVVDALSLPYVRGAVVDWEENLVRQAFCVRDNDNAEAGCGCGVSFAAKE